MKASNGLAAEFANGATGLLDVDMISCRGFPDADDESAGEHEIDSRCSTQARQPVFCADLPCDAPGTRWLART